MPQAAPTSDVHEATIDPMTNAPVTLKVSQFQISEFAYARMAATLPEGIKIEDTLKPEFWVHVCHLFQKNKVTNDGDKTGAIIEIRTEDHAFYAELYVRAVQDRGLLVALATETVYFGPKAVVTGKKYEVKWNLSKRGYDIIRISDREIVGNAENIPTKESAQKWINETMKD